MELNHKKIKALGIIFATTTSGILAGDFSPVEMKDDKSSKKNAGDWCESLEDIGRVYKNKKNPWIREIEFGGRFHHQWGHTDGTDNGRDFSGAGYEMRRLRLKMDVKLLDNFTLATAFNFERGEFGDTSIGYDGLDRLVLHYDFGDLGAFKKFEMSYGLHKFGFGGEEAMSSKDIKTIERSLLNNEFRGERTTGLRGTFEVGDNIDFIYGIFSTEERPGNLGQWNGGILYHFGSDFDALGGHVDIQGFYNDATEDKNDVHDYRWALNVTYDTEIGKFDIMTNISYGEDYNSDAVYGIVIMPSIELIKNKLEAVLRYQWAHSEDGDLRPQNRNVGTVATDDFGFGIRLPQGENNHNIYTGLNYFICDTSAKLMLGVEYESNTGLDADTEATTLWGAVRFNF